MITSALTRLLGRLPIGWLQLVHNRTRLAASIGGVTFANVLIFMQLGFRSALFETSVLTHHSLRADVVLVSSDFRSLREANPLPRARLHEALGVDGVRDAAPVYLGTLHWSDPATADTTNFRVIGVDPDHASFVDPALERAARRLREPDTALADVRTRDFPPALAEAIEADRAEIELGGRRVDLIGLFAQGASFDVDGSLVVSDQTFLRLFPARDPGTPSLVLVDVEPGRSPAQVAAGIDARLSGEDARAWSKPDWIAAEQAYQSRQTPIGFVFGFGVAMGFVVGLVIVYQVLSTDVQDHLAEYATFKAIGYGPRFFFSLVFEEALSLAALGFAPALLISLVLYQVAAGATALPIAMPWTRPLFVFGLTAAMCVASEAIATRRLNAADPAELF